MKRIGGPSLAHRALLLAVMVVCSSLPDSGARATAGASDSSGPGEAQPLDRLLQMDLSDLLRAKVALPSRRPEDRFDAATAIYVISAEEIRRSGLVSIPELLRLVPGLHVGRIDAGKWAIGSRSPMNRFTNTMRVLMDGRELFNPLFGGVYWDVQDVYLPDVARIEVIRGPGASLWGANAVTGIINIVTRDAGDTQGGSMRLAGGAGDSRLDGGARYGGALGDAAHWRMYARGRWRDSGEYLGSGESTNQGFFEPGKDAHDDGWLAQGGFRADWRPAANDHLTLQGDGYGGRSRNVRIVTDPVFGPEPLPNDIDVSGANLLGRWTHDFANRSEGAAQLYWDHTRREDDAFEESRHTIDLDLQHAQPLPRQLLTWGGGVRVTWDDTELTSSGSFALKPENRVDPLYSLFVQDRLELVRERLALIAGTKFEYNNYTEGEWQPTGRLQWTPSSLEEAVRHMLWAAVSRPVRIPTRAEQHARLVVCDPSIPGCVIDISDAGAGAEKLLSYELGGRLDLDDRVVVDLALFYDDYYDAKDRLTGPFSIATRRIYGSELTIWLQPLDPLRIEGSYTFHRGESKTGTGATPRLDSLPEHSVHAAFDWQVRQDVDFGVNVYYTSALDRPAPAIDVPAYTRLDLRLAWRPAEDWEVSATGTNLLDAAHPEATDAQRVNTGFRRGGMLQVERTFW